MTSPDALPAILKEFVEEVEKLEQEAGSEEEMEWRTFLQDHCVPAMDETIQGHLKNCARCRFQSKISKRKKDEPMTTLPTESDLLSLCVPAMDELTVTGGCGVIVKSELDKLFEEVSERSKQIRPSEEESRAVDALLSRGDDITFSNLRAVQKESSDWLAQCAVRRPIVELLDKQDDIIRTCREYYHNRVVPMAEHADKINAVSSGRLYVLDKGIYEDTVDSLLNQLQKAATIKANLYLRTHGKPFCVDGQPFADKPAARLLEEEIQAPPSSSRRTSGKPRVRTPTKAKEAKKGPVLEIAGLSLDQTVLYPRPECPILFNIDADTHQDDPHDPEALKVRLDRTGDVGEGQIGVCVRVRPFVVREQRNAHKQLLTTPDPHTIHLVHTVGTKEKSHEMQFQNVCDGKTTQEHFYSVIDAENMLERITNGVNSTVFAYGQTGSGKTFTMAGPADVLGLQQNAHLVHEEETTELTQEVLETMLKGNLAAQGLMPRLTHRLFETISNIENENENIRFVVVASYVEIYNEQVQDLLTSEVNNLKVRELPDNSGFYVDELTKRECKAIPDLLGVIVDGTRNRRVVAHEMNSESSRSHAVLIINVEKRTYDKNTNTIWVKRGKLNLIDLAGSESVKLTKTAGTSLRETAGINKSLLSLSNIIAKLSETSQKKGDGGGETAEHVPWRNSKLTMLLMDSLSGSGHTLMVAACSPSSEYYAETMSTLQFATKAPRPCPSLGTHSEYRSIDSSYAATPRFQPPRTPIRGGEWVTRRLPSSISSFAARRSRTL